MIIPFQTVDWTTIAAIEHPGETGTSFWQTLQFEGLRIRMVQYSQNYLADHWCTKGHIVHCLEGAFISRSIDGKEMHLNKGMSYVVTDEASTHKSYSREGASLIIIDGDFLKKD